MYRFVFVAALGLASLSPQRASAEYAWVGCVKHAASQAASKIGQWWSCGAGACAGATRGWLRRRVDCLAPAAKAEAARRCGLRLPDGLRDDDRLVVLIHGLDSSADYWRNLAPLLEREGYAVAWLAYPNDQPLADSAALLAIEMARLRGEFPRAQTDIVAHSMGGIVARAYLEGEAYAGGVRRLILLAPPNHGSCYSQFSVLSDIVEHCRLCQTEPEWSWSWMITDGLGEARNDLAPGSPFLTRLNARARRKEVRYTIVAGNRSCGWRYAANAVRWSAVCVPDHGWAKPVDSALHHWAERLESKTGNGDGLVSIHNALLPGVGDFVILPADHTTIACSRGGRPPAAWPLIKDRLAR